MRQLRKLAPGVSIAHVILPLNFIDHRLRRDASNRCSAPTPKPPYMYHRNTNVIAVVDLSAKIASRRFQYSVAVKNAKEDIGRLQGEVSRIGDVLGRTKKLLEGPEEMRLSSYPTRSRGIPCN